MHSALFAGDQVPAAMPQCDQQGIATQDCPARIEVGDERSMPPPSGTEHSIYFTNGRAKSTVKNQRMRSGEAKLTHESLLNFT